MELSGKVKLGALSGVDDFKQRAKIKTIIDRKSLYENPNKLFTILLISILSIWEN